jgi:hypothetical protein
MEKFAYILVTAKGGGRLVGFFNVLTSAKALSHVRTWTLEPSKELAA